MMFSRRYTTLINGVNSGAIVYLMVVLHPDTTPETNKKGRACIHARRKQHPPNIDHRSIERALLGERGQQRANRCKKNLLSRHDAFSNIRIQKVTYRFYSLNFRTQILSL